MCAHRSRSGWRVARRRSFLLRQRKYPAINHCGSILCITIIILKTWIAYNLIIIYMHNLLWVCREMHFENRLQCSRCMHEHIAYSTCFASAQGREMGCLFCVHVHPPSHTVRRHMDAWPRLAFPPLPCKIQKHTIRALSLLGCVAAPKIISGVHQQLIKRGMGVGVQNHRVFYFIHS